MKLEDVIKQLQAAKVTVPFKLYEAAINESYAKQNVVQVWACPKCPTFRYKACVKSLEIQCPKGHVCTVIWKASQ